MYSYIYEDYREGIINQLNEEATKLREEINDENTEYLNDSWNKVERLNPIASKRDRILLCLAAVIQVMTTMFYALTLHGMDNMCQNPQEALYLQIIWAF